MNKPTVSIGIPAFNEEANINDLLDDLAQENPTNYILSEIIIVSDASTDRTHEIVRARHDPSIKLVINSKRQGQAFAQNRILKQAHGDILVLLNADIRLTGPNFIAQLIRPLLSSKATLVHPQIVPITPRTKIGKILSISWQLKRAIYNRLKMSNHLLTSHGAARAMSRRLVSRMIWPKVVGEDAYLYLYNKNLGNQSQYVPQAQAHILLPSTLTDHLAQSRRFEWSRRELEQYFGKKLIRQEYSIPSYLLTTQLIKYGLQNPIAMTTYIAITIWGRLTSDKPVSTQWAISNTTKRYA